MDKDNTLNYINISAGLFSYILSIIIIVFFSDKLEIKNVSYFIWAPIAGLIIFIFFYGAVAFIAWGKHASGFRIIFSQLILGALYIYFLKIGTDRSQWEPLDLFWVFNAMALSIVLKQSVVVNGILGVFLALGYFGKLPHFFYIFDYVLIAHSVAIPFLMAFKVYKRRTPEYP